MGSKDFKGCIGSFSQVDDQLFFVNKTIKSESLSQSQPNERFYLMSYTRARAHKTKLRNLTKGQKTGKAPDNTQRSPAQVRVGTHGVLASRKTLPSGPNDKEYLHRDHVLHSGLGLHSPGMSALDPFYSSCASVDAYDQHIVDFTLRAGLVNTSFQAEALYLNSQIQTHFVAFRHQGAIQERLKRCVDDVTVLSTTLAYCSHALVWATGSLNPEKPPESYTLPAIRVLRDRLKMSTEKIDVSLFLAIYALAVSDLWSRNFAAAVGHLQAIDYLSKKVGGLNNIDSYIMEGIVMTDKYVAMHYQVPPVLKSQWHITALQNLDGIYRAMSRKFPQTISGFLELGDFFVGEDMMCFLRDLRVFYLVVEHIRMKPDVDFDEQRWLFLQNQSLSARLLSLQQQATELQSCCCIALLTWLLKNTTYFGAQRWAKIYASRLKLALDPAFQLMMLKAPRMLLWILVVGGMASFETTYEDWFVSRIIAVAKEALFIGPEIHQVKLVCKCFVLLEDEVLQLGKLLDTL